MNCSFNKETSLKNSSRLKNSTKSIRRSNCCK